MTDIRLFLLSALILLIGCSAPTTTYPEVGSVEYQAATLLAPKEMHKSLQLAIDDWKEATNGRVQISLSDDGWLSVQWWDLEPGIIGASYPGYILVASWMRNESEKSNEVNFEHELGHCLLGHAHSQDPKSIMFLTAGNDATITPEDVARPPH